MINLLDKFALPVGLTLIISLVIGAYFIIDKTSAKDIDSPSNQIVIDIAGAVSQPGIYNFDQGAIIEDAINKAGGVTDEANVELIAKTINRAALLQDHGKIYIPSIQNTTNDNQLTSQEATNLSQTQLININTADTKLLDTLPSIGPITAERIIEYRKNKGQFRRKDDLMRVEGISTSKYNKLKDLITI